MLFYARYLFIFSFSKFFCVVWFPPLRMRECSKLLAVQPLVTLDAILKGQNRVFFTPLYSFLFPFPSALIGYLCVWRFFLNLPRFEGGDFLDPEQVAAALFFDFRKPFACSIFGLHFLVLLPFFPPIKSGKQWPPPPLCGIGLFPHFPICLIPRFSSFSQRF